MQGGIQLSRSNANDPAIWKRSGNELFKRGLYKIALKFYSKAIELNPGFIEAWNNMGLSFLMIGKIDEARRCNDKVKELKRRNQVRYVDKSSLEENKQYTGSRPAAREHGTHDNFWYAFCFGILLGISLMILSVNSLVNDTTGTLGIIWSISAIFALFVFLVLQYVVHPPRS